jgi:CO dehydrogenase maturation factor
MGQKKIAFLGKGGVGKTILSALTGKIFSENGQRVLYVDADPARGLTTSLGIGEIKTIGEAREEIIRRAKIADSEEEKERIADIIDYLLLEALYESPRFSLISMGQSDSLGCYCPINNLLRSTINAIGSQYDVVIIDAEAGIEQVNRQVVETVDHPVIVTDNSLRGARTALMIYDLIGKIPAMKTAAAGVIFNRVDKASPDLIEKITGGGLRYYGDIPPDPVITGLDLRGESLFDISGEATSVKGTRKILTGAGITGR